jgi:hypothetical protein
MLLLPIIVEAYGAKACVVGCSVLAAFLLPLTICLPLSFLSISLPVCAAVMSTVLVGQNLLCQRVSVNQEETILMNTYYRMCGTVARVILPLVATQLVGVIGDTAWLIVFGIVAVITIASSQAIAFYIPGTTFATKTKPVQPWHATVVTTLQQQVEMIRHPEVGHAMLTQLLQCVHFGVQKQYQMFYLQELGQSTPTIGLLLSLSSVGGLASIYLFNGLVGSYGPVDSLRCIYAGQAITLLAVCASSSPVVVMALFGVHQMLDSATPTPNSIWMAEAVKGTGIAGAGDPSTLIASAYAFQKLAVYLALFFAMPAAGALVGFKAGGGTVAVFAASAVCCCTALVASAKAAAPLSTKGGGDKAE